MQVHGAQHPSLNRTCQVHRLDSREAAGRSGAAPALLQACTCYLCLHACYLCHCLTATPITATQGARTLQPVIQHGKHGCMHVHVHVT